MTSDKPYAGIFCTGYGDTEVGVMPGCGKVDLTEAEYMQQMAYPNRRWHCPRCGGPAEFDDERFEELMEEKHGDQ